MFQRIRCQWTWQRIRQLGGMDPEDMRLKDHSDADVSPLDGSDERREKRMGAELDLSAWQEGMESSGDKNILALDGWVDQFESKDDFVDENNLDKQVGVLFLPETLHWANKAALDHQLAWANFEEFLDDLKNPKHTDPAKKEEFKFAPYFDSAVLAHQYFFAENDDMKKVLKSKAIKPKKRQRGPQRYKDADELIQAIKMRSDWADKLSLPDIQRALGMQKRAALRDRILEEKKKLLAILNTDDGNHLNQFKEEIADFATLGAREDKHQEWAYDQLWALVGKLFDKLARLPAMQDNGLDATPLTTKQLNDAHINDIGHKFVFSVLDNKHWLHPIIFPKADPNDPTSPFDEEKSPTDYTCDPNKLNHKIEEDRDFEVLRRTAEFISGSLLSYMDVSADVIGESHIKSTVVLLHSQTTGLKLQRENLSLGQVLQPQLKASGLEVDIPNLPEGSHLIRVEFSDTKLAGADELQKLNSESWVKKNNLVDIPNSKDNLRAVIKNKQGAVLGGVGREQLKNGYGLNPGAWEKLQESNWHTTKTNVWVLNDQESLVGRIDVVKPVLKNALLPSLALVEFWSIGRAVRDFQQEKNIRNNPMALANLVSAVADASGLAIDAVKVFHKYAHAKAAYSHGVRIWDKFLLSRTGYSALSKWAGRANAAASAISAIISLINVIDNLREGDDAWVGHGVMMSGFIMLTYGALAIVGLGFMIAAFGLVLLGAALLKWVFKENDLMEQWLEFGPFAKKGVSEVYSGTGGRMKREPQYTVYTDYGTLILDKQKRLKAVSDMDDFYWEGNKLMLQKFAPLDKIDGVDELEIGRLNGPVNLDALANKSQRLASDEYAVVDDWRNHPLSSAEDLASLIFQPNFQLEEVGKDLEVTCFLNGVVANQANFSFKYG